MTRTKEFAEQYHQLVDSLDDIVFRFDARGRWTLLSPSWQKWLRWEPATCIGRVAARFIHPEDRPPVLERWGAVLAGTDHRYRGEVRFRDVDGNFRWMLVNARGHRDGAGVLRGVTGTLTDVSEAKALEQQLIAARAAAEAANKAKSEFLSTISHELRTPLNAVIGLSDSLLESDSAADPERTRRYLSLINSSGRQLLTQINGILDLARIDAGRLQPNPAPFDVVGLARGLLAGVAGEARSKSLVLDAVLPAEPCALCSDVQLVRQIIQNLLANALKFTPANGKVTLRVDSHGPGTARIAVSDTGIGIASGKVDALFRPFSQVDSSLARRFGGTGLGLALVDRITRLLGGTVTVQSSTGQGSTFTVELVSLPAGGADAETAPGVFARTG